MKRLVVAAALAAGLAIPVAAMAVPKVGQPAPAFSLPTVDGRMLTLASLKGRPVYLNFYATWCAPCNEEAPVIGKLSNKYRTRGLTVLGVNELEDPRKAKEFLAKYHLTYGAVVDGDGQMGKDYGAIGLPVHIFIDRDGVVKTYRLGEMNRDEIEMAIKGIL
jgi:cytochrome c biogenesis protein CcmG, thiol:disulfide interchange protein DsbE